MSMVWWVCEVELRLHGVKHGYVDAVRFSLVELV